MKSMLTPVAGVTCVSVGDTVRDAYDRLESHDVTAAPLLDAQGHYVGTITEADLRRHLAGRRDRSMACEERLACVERHGHNPAVTTDYTLGALSMRAAGHGFVPVVDDAGKLVGVIDRRKLAHLRLAA
jgi:CBS domain-containing protein